jgi:hypothetical protein
MVDSVDVNEFEYADDGGETYEPVDHCEMDKERRERYAVRDDNCQMDKERRERYAVSGLLLILDTRASRYGIIWNISIRWSYEFER